MICEDQQKLTLCAQLHTGRNICLIAKGPVMLYSFQYVLILFSSPLLVSALSLSLSRLLMFEKYNRIVFSAWGYLHVLKLNVLF